MKSELRFTSPNIKLGATIGLFITVLVIFFSYRYQWQVGVILLGIGGGIALIVVSLGIGVLGKVVYKFALWRLDFLERKEAVRLATYQADRAGLERYVLNFPKTQRLVTLPDSNVRVIDAVAEPAQLPASSQQQAIKLLPALENEQRVLIVGASNSGKTELLKWIAQRRGQTSNVVVIDPHAYLNKWPVNQVIGIGRNYPEIDKTLQALVQLMQKRYKDIGSGKVIEGQHKPVCCIVDEWRAITGNLDNAGDALKTLLTESRKASMSMFVASHSDRAKPLGLSGEYDLKDGFVIVRLSVQDGVRTATLDAGNGEQAAVLPGAFGGNGRGDNFTVEPLDLEVQPNSTEAAILQLHRQGEHHKAICEAMGWTPGGKQYQRIDEVLSKFG